MTDERTKTGIPGLDEVLQGGFMPGSSVLLEGPPGSGKTNLGLQILYNGATEFDEPGFLISFEEFPDQIYRDAMSLGMDLLPLRQDRQFAVIQTSPMKLQESIAGTGTITEEELEVMFDRINPKRVLIDSVTHFRRITTEEGSLRDLLLNLLRLMNLRNITTFLTKEIQSVDSAQIAFEEYLVDASLRLHNQPPGNIGGTRRSLEVRKTRGHGHLSGRHPFDFTSRGMRIYPHRRPAVEASLKSSDEDSVRLSSGVHGLDFLLHGGYVKGSSNLLAGTAGAGKSTFALHYIRDGIEKKEASLLVVLNESPSRAAQALSRIKVDVDQAIQDNLLVIHYAMPVELCPEQLFAEIESFIEANKTQRVVIDGVSDFTTSVQDSNVLRDYLYTLVRTFERKGVTAVLTCEMEQVTGTLGMEDINYAFVLDTAIYLGFCEVESQMRRVITILKQRASAHESELRELVLSPDGPKIGTKFTGLSGVTGGVPTGQYQATMDEMIQPLTFIKGFANQLRKGKVSKEKQEGVLVKMIEQSELMLNYICDHFGVDPEKVLKKK